MAKITIAYLKEKYPDPKKSTIDRGGGEAYCVGGAFMLARGKSNHFPFSGQLWAEIEKYRDELGLPVKEVYAHITRLIRDNDDGRFESAWKELSIALNGGE